MYACYRFAKQLRDNRPALDACFTALAASSRAELPECGHDIAMDASDLPAYANGQRFVKKGGPERERFSDPDASWGHRSVVSTRAAGSFYGFRLHAAVSAATGLPLAWRVQSARSNEGPFAAPILDSVIARGFTPLTCALDKGYDASPVYHALSERGCVPVIPLKRPLSAETKPSRNDTPRCEHGFWTSAGADFKRKAARWRCPTGECEPKSTWLKGSRRNPLIPRETKRWRDLYRGRASVEREFGRLKHEWGLGPIRVRGIEKVALHADLCISARLACALAVPLAA